MAIYGVSCDACGYQQRASDLPRSYLLPSGSELDIVPQWAWCLSCCQLVAAEWMSSREEFVMPDDAEELGLAEYWQQQILLEAEWQKLRQAPPRCLSCGSLEFLAFQIDRATGSYAPISHPGCGGSLTLQSKAFSRPAKRILYTPEGDFLEEHTR